jgi:hypothetical protein
MTDTQVDAITGATPGNGKLTYIWDGTDQNGVRVPKGKYHFFVEGTLYWKSRVVFSGIVNWVKMNRNQFLLKHVISTNHPSIKT